MSFVEVIRASCGRLAAREFSAFSIATRLSAWFVAIAAMLALVVGVGLYAALVTQLNRTSDEFLASDLEEMRATFRTAHLTEDNLSQKIDEEQEAHPPIFIRLTGETGRSAYETKAMPEFLRHHALPAPEAIAADGALLSTRKAPGGREFRILIARISGTLNGTPATWTLQLALDISPHTLLRRRFIGWLVVLMGLCLLGAAIAAHRMVAWQLRPLRHFISSAARIDARTLEHRVELSQLPVEIRELGSAFNLMLDRLEASYKRLDQCSDNLAHELRTPVSQMMLGLEIALRRDRTPEEYCRVLSNARQQCQRLVRIVESLTFLARAGEEDVRLAMRVLDAAAELETVRKSFAEAARAAGVEVATACADGLCFQGDSTSFQQAIGNLMRNALRHTPNGGRITITAARAGAGGIVIEVADTGEGIAPEHLPHLFTRCYFAHIGRAAGDDRIGLGLSLTKSIVEMHGGTIAIDSALGQGTRVRIVIPEAREPESHQTIYENDDSVISGSSEGNDAPLS